MTVAVIWIRHPFLETPSVAVVLPPPMASVARSGPLGHERNGYPAIDDVAVEGAALAEVGKVVGVDRVELVGGQQANAVFSVDVPPAPKMHISGRLVGSVSAVARCVYERCGAEGGVVVGIPRPLQCRRRVPEVIDAGEAVRVGDERVKRAGHLTLLQRARWARQRISGPVAWLGSAAQLGRNVGHDQVQHSVRVVIDVPEEGHEPVVLCPPCRP